MHPEVAGPLLQFPIEMYLSMRGEGSDANVLLCPWYLACALVVMYHGASGATRRQIAQAMHVDDDGSVVSVLDSHASRMFCRDYRRPLHTHSGLNVTSYSCLFHDERVKLSSYFVEPLSGLDMHSHVRDFARSSAQCCRGLNGLLRSLAGFAFQEDVFGKGSIDADTMVVLASVFSFQSRWFCDGDARALTGHFCRPSGEGGVVKETVPMLRLRGSFRFANFKDDDGFEVTVLEIPFQDPRRSIAIFLPAQSSSFEALEDRLDAPNVLKCLSRLERHRLAEVILPKLKMNCVADLKRHLPLLGAVNVFTEAADLCNMSTLEGLKVSAAKQVSVFSIGRRGAGTPEAQAAASDATRTVLGTDAVKIVVDRPFFFLIVARDPDTVLLLGSVTRVL
ncbi:ipis-1-like [Haemaphysalis longicornis]